MRIAGRAGWGVVLVAAGLGGAVLAKRLLHPPITDDLRLVAEDQPLELDARLPPPPPGPPFRFQARGTTQHLARTPSLALPPWFGDTAAAPVRIAGRVIGTATTVRLALDVPDPGIWIGRELAVATDGSFDFGPMRRGAYRLIAWSRTGTSRGTPVDTTRDPGDDAELFVYPCEPLTGTTSRLARDAYEGAGATPAAGATIELLGRPIGESDGSGRFTFCAENARDFQVRLADHDRAPASQWITGAVDHALMPTTTIVGTVLDPDDQPAAAVGVEPMWRVPNTDPGDCADSDLIVTTDAAGRFTYAGYDKLCGFRIHRNTSVQRPWLGDRETSIQIVPSGTIDRVIVHLAPPPPPLAPHHLLRGRVLLHGVPVADAQLRATDRAWLPSGIWTRSDGSFTVALFGDEHECRMRAPLDIIDHAHHILGSATLAWSDGLEPVTLELANR